MQELAQIDTPAQHACDSPRVERWHVLEPVSARWSWLRVYICCGQALDELAPGAAASADPAGRRPAARRAA